MAKSQEELFDEIMNDPQIKDKIKELEELFYKKCNEKGIDFGSKDYDYFVNGLAADLKYEGWDALSYLAVLLAD